MILGGLGPAMAEAILIFAWGSQRQKRDYGRRVLDVRRIGWGWAAVIFLMFPALNAIATLLSVATGGPQPTFETVTRLLANPLSIIPYLLFLFVFGPLPEELGWSGYALDGLQAKRSALTSSLIIGLIWAVWHLPLFFMEGTFQSEQIGFATPAFWWYMLPTLPISVLDTWIYNNANRSTLSAVLLHFMVNLSGELFGLSQHARFYQAGLIFVVTAAIIAIWGPKTLTRQSMAQKEERLTAPA
jgi:membrane protease YdiL (CAAX protease family)